MSVPSEIDQLQRMPGVGRKTANVIASVIYDAPAMAVDTHVFRVANRIGLTRGKTPLAVEKDLVKAPSRAYHRYGASLVDPYMGDMFALREVLNATFVKSHIFANTSKTTIKLKKLAMLIKFRKLI
jgi:endonuclease III-like uncharacterized protein